jgi:hypothetical protein
VRDLVLVLVEKMRWSVLGGNVLPFVYSFWLYAQCVDYLLLVSSIEIEVRPIMCNGGDINTNAASLQS